MVQGALRAAAGAVARARRQAMLVAGERERVDLARGRTVSKSLCSSASLAQRKASYVSVPEARSSLPEEPSPGPAAGPGAAPAAAASSGLVLGGTAAAEGSLASAPAAVAAAAAPASASAFRRDSRLLGLIFFFSDEADPGRQTPARLLAQSCVGDDPAVHGSGCKKKTALGPLACPRKESAERGVTDQRSQVIRAAHAPRSIHANAASVWPSGCVGRLTKTNHILCFLFAIHKVSRTEARHQSGRRLYVLSNRNFYSQFGTSYRAAFCGRPLKEGPSPVQKPGRREEDSLRPFPPTTGSLPLRQQLAMSRRVIIPICAAKRRRGRRENTSSRVSHQDT